MDDSTLMKERIIVLGAGGGGQAMAAVWAKAGYRVVLYDRYPQVIAPILEKGGIEIQSAAVQGLARMERVTTDMKEALSEQGIVFVVLPAFAHAFIAENIAPLLRPDDAIVLSPGSTGGALEVRKILRERGAPSTVKVGETNTLIYACRITGPAQVSVYGVKQSLRVAALPATETKALLQRVRGMCPQARADANVLSTSLGNLNPVFHVYTTLANLGWIEKTRGGFRFYHDGATDSVGKLIEAVDRERMNICHSLGITTLSALEWQEECYGATGKTVSEVLCANPAYAEVQAPSSVRARQLEEDIPMGLVPMSAIAKITGIATPFMDCAILLASEILGQDYRVTGRNLQAMGLAGMNKNDLLAYVTNARL